MDQNLNIVLVRPGLKKGLPDDLQNWIEHFIRHFNLVLSRVLGSAQKIILLSDENSQELKTVKENDIFVFVLHDFCLKDKNHQDLLKKIAALMGSPDADTTESCRNSLKINLSDYDLRQLHDKIKPCMGYDLYRKGEKEASVQLISKSDKEYWPRLLDLVMDIRGIKLRHDKEAKEVPIFLSITAEDEKHNWYQLRRELMGFGYKIFPDVDLHFTIQNLKSYVQRCVDKSLLSIHLLGNEYGNLYSGSDKSLPELQFQYVTEYINTIQGDPDLESHSLLQRVIWIPPVSEIKDEKQEEFIQQVKRDIEKLHRTEIVQAPIEILKTLVLNKLQEIEGKKKDEFKIWR